MVKKNKQPREGKPMHKGGTHTGNYTPGDVAHVQLSDSNKLYDHPARMKPDPQGGSMWGDPNGLGMTHPGGLV